MSTNLAPPASPLNAAHLAPDPDKKPRPKKQKVFPPFEDYILATLRAIEEEGKQEEIERQKTYVEAHNFYAGNQIGYASDVTFDWVNTQSKDDPYQIDNIVLPAVEILAALMSRARIEVKVEPRRRDDQKCKEGAERAEEELRDELKRIKDAFFTQTENKFSILTGDYWRYTGTEDDPDEAPLRVPRAASSDVAPLSRGGVHVCPDCGYSEKAEAQTAEPRPHVCPDCFAPMNLIAAGNVTASRAEYEERPARRVFTIPVDPGSVKVSPRSRRPVMDSPYLWWRLRVDRATLEEAHPDKEIPSTGIHSEAMKYQKRLEEEAARSTPGAAFDDTLESATARSTGGEQLEEIETDMVWLERHVYAQYIFPRATTLPSGRKVPAGAKGKDVWPRGLFISKAGTTLLDDADESKRDRWASGKYRIIPTSAHGGGISDIIGDNKQINELRNLDFYDALYNGSGREIYDPAKIQGGQLSGDPTVAIAAENLDEGENLLTGVAVRLPGTNGIPGAERLRQQIEASAQNKTGAMPTNLAASSIDVAALGTATGITAQTEAFHGRVEPSQTLRAQVEEDHGYQVLIARQEVLRERAAADPSMLSDTGLRWFLEADVRRDYRLEASPGSWMPVTETQRQGYLDRVLQIMSLQPPREILEYALELYKIPVSVDPTQAIRREAQVRLEAILSTARLVEEETAILDEAGEISQDALLRVFKFADVPVDAENDQHPVFIDFYLEYLLSPEARRLSKFQLAAIKARLAEHRIKMVAQQQEALRDEKAAQAPELEAQQVIDQQKLQTDEQRMQVEQEMAADDREHELGANLVQGAAEAVGQAAQTQGG